ncbi:MAG: phenylalanine--tRNA ligase subunit beta, partial [Undibacterium sp.]|nr:phenylalanine--tRNA ligase subunit beta [Undibacterium sp.]
LPEQHIVAVALSEKLPVKISAPDLCGRFSGRVIRGVNAKAPTPDWMKQRLERSGQRPISALVDISNYVMLEMGRPSHVFDLDKIHGGLDVRWGRAGETLKLLNGNTVEIDEWVGVIADHKEIESLAGIMGGDSTAVTLETENIYLESAFWWPQAIQGRARKYNFSTDAAHRYERGVDYATTVEHLERITALIVEICGGAEHVKVGPMDDHIVNIPKRHPVKLRTARANKVIGVTFSDAQIADIFTRLALPFTQEPGEFLVTPPSYRFDIEIEEDLIEEVVRVYGFENIPSLPPVAANAMLIAPENTRSSFTVRRQIADLDYQEVVNYSFVEEVWEKDFCGNDHPIKLQNPIASQMSVMRTSLIASLVANTRYNLNRKQSRVRIFELAGVYLRDNTVVDGALTLAGYAQPKRLAALVYGPLAPEQWGQTTRNVDFFDMKADLENLFAPKALRFEKIDHPSLHPGRSAQVICDAQVIGMIGELHPRLQQQYDLPLAPIVFEVDLAALQAVHLPSHQEISKFPTVTRDLALVVKQSVTVQAVLDAFHVEINEAKSCKYVQDLVLFDEYRGKGLENDEKSLAFRISLQDTQGTLQDETVELAMADLVAAASKFVGARLR